MLVDGFAARDHVAPDALPADLIDATVPGNVQLAKGTAPAAVSILVEIDVQTVPI